MMVNEASGKQVVVPINNKPLKKGTLASILRHAEISINDLKK